VTSAGTPTDWACVEELFTRALQHPAHDRAAFLDAACAGDTRLREEVASLLASSSGASERLRGAIAKAIRRELATLRTLRTRRK